MTEVLEGRASRLTDLSCLEVPASQAEQGRNLRAPGEARWDKTSRQVTSPLHTYRGGLEGREVVVEEPRPGRGPEWNTPRV